MVKTSEHWGSSSVGVNNLKTINLRATLFYVLISDVVQVKKTSSVGIPPCSALEYAYVIKQAEKITTRIY